MFEHRQAESRPVPHDHAVQFYEDDRFLVDTVARFLTPGMLAGQPAIVVATETHRQALTARLESEGIDVDGACFRGRLLFLDPRHVHG